LYSIFYVPRKYHHELLSKIYSILKNESFLLITLGVDNVLYKEKKNFCNAKMAWSHFDISKNLKLLEKIGFKIVKKCNEKDYGSDESHMWVLAVKN